MCTLKLILLPIQREDVGLFSFILGCDSHRPTGVDHNRSVALGPSNLSVGHRPVLAPTATRVPLPIVLHFDRKLLEYLQCCGHLVPWKPTRKAILCPIARFGLLETVSNGNWDGGEWITGSITCMGNKVTIQMSVKSHALPSCMNEGWNISLQTLVVWALYGFEWRTNKAPSQRFRGKHWKAKGFYLYFLLLLYGSVR